MKPRQASRDGRRYRGVLAGASRTANSFLAHLHGARIQVIWHMTSTRALIFYSWQSDLPNATNRSFIQQALENTAKVIAQDRMVGVEPVIDRDTQGVAGAPDIAKTIFGKILAADVFVADVSIIAGCREGRPTPNPNVLIELGYALHALSDERVILVLNKAHGGVEQLPFDLKMRRVIPYHMPEVSDDRAPERKALEGRLRQAILSALMSREQAAPTSTLTYRAIAAHLCDAMAQVFVGLGLNDCRPMTLILEGRDVPDARTVEGLSRLAAILRAIPNRGSNDLSDKAAGYYEENKWDLDQLCTDLLARVVQLSHGQEQDLIDALMGLDLVRRAFHTSIIAHKQVVTGGVFVHVADLVDASAEVYRALLRRWKASP